MEPARPHDEWELPPTVVADHPTQRCEWCGRPVDAAVEARELAADVGRRTHRYLPRRYRACDDACRAGVVHFVRRHLSLGPLLWSLTVASFLTALAGLLAILPPPLRLLRLSLDELFVVLGILGLLGTVTGALVAALPYSFIARRPEGDPPTVPLRRTRTLNRILGLVMALFSAVVALRVALWL
ncbi:MAG: hypothetical protein JXB32_07200 [Deltaproteobacteria bacterium]|nr:hypothetical protein [Deltaproteobacteria bacterium]